MSTKYETFLLQLRYQVPHFDELDRNPEFLKWVDKKGINLESIARRMDAQEAAKVYHAFVQQQGQKAGYWTREDIKKAYDEKLKGKYSDDEFKQIEKSIFQAQKEGRIR